MRKLTIQLVVAIHTFALGVAIVSFWAEGHFYVLKDNLNPQPAVVSKLQPSVPEGWRKIEEHKFSIYLPPDMKVSRDVLDIMNVDGSVEGMDMYANKNLWIWYVYGKKSSCDPHPAMAFHFSAVEVAGKSAKLFVYPPDETLMDLCVFDIGDGKTSLWVRASGRNKSALNLARRVFDSIEFR